MHYEFPRIAHLNDVLPAIADKPEFGAFTRGHLVIVNYHVQTPTSFTGPHEAVLRECRGLVFDQATGLLLNRRFHKFMNVNERADTLYGNLPWDREHVIMTKLDGSMISPVPIAGNLSDIRWISKMGITDVAMEAEAHVATRQEYTHTARVLLGRGYTPIFEWCSPANRIVVEYPEDRLVLLAARNTFTGEYLPLSEITSLGQRLGVPTVAYSQVPYAAENFLKDAKALSGAEGFVVQFLNGHMVKVKTDWYVQIHKAKDVLAHPRHIVSAAISGSIDDILALLPEPDRVRVEAYMSRFWARINDIAENLSKEMTGYQSRLTRKEFAVTVAPTLASAFLHYRVWDGASCRDAVMEAVSRNISSNSVFDERIPKLFGEGSWTTI